MGTDGVLLGAWAQVGNAHTILDVGTGTGVIALMMAQRSQAQITALEPDQESYREACANAEASPWAHRVSMH